MSLIVQFVDNIMAFTYFFRDAQTLDLIREHIVPVMRTRRFINIWDAGCAMGQEPYSLAMILRENMGPMIFRNVKIHATDIDASNLFGDIIRLGIYNQEETQRITDHAMHRERYAISPAAAAAIGGARRVFAIGTTPVRVLETCGADGGPIAPCAGSTDIFIYPPYQFRTVHALLTNFHLPKSTLLMLVSAFAGRELILEAYAEAVREKYRFYSYGDCMLILP